MTPEQIREIVKITLDELTNRKLIKDDYQSVLRVVEKKLRGYFNGNDKAVGSALRTLSDDPYIDIIYLHYRDDLTLENIAEYYDKEVSTIKRNKKRLIYKIYDLLEEG
jgi:DNA-directed RNA polymerase specialized sigma24 family protein